MKLSMWTPELKEKVASLWKTHTSRQICEALLSGEGISVTRNQIIGIVHRMGLNAEHKTDAHPMTPHKGQRRVAKPKTRSVLRIVSANGNSDRQRIFKTVARELPALKCIEIEPLHLSLNDLTKDTCKWPLGDGPFTFCGHPSAEGKSYCKPHCAISYVEPKPHLPQRGGLAA